MLHPSMLKISCKLCSVGSVLHHRVKSFDKCSITCGMRGQPSQNERVNAYQASDKENQPDPNAPDTIDCTPRPSVCILGALENVKFIPHEG